MGVIKNYDEAKTRINDFLQNFYKSDEDGNKNFVYADKVTDLAARKFVALYVELADVNVHDPDLKNEIQNNTRRYQKLFAQCIDGMIEKILDTMEAPVLDALDAFVFQRRYVDKKEQETKQEGNQVPEDPKNSYPEELMRRFEIYFIQEPVAPQLAVRDIRANCVGKLVTMRGVVIRVSDVKPSVSVITYSCDTCGAELYQTISTRSFQPLIACQSKDCVDSKAGGRLQLQHRGSKMPKFQEIRIQEMSDQVPVGSIPRATTAFCYGENTRKVQPGDQVLVCGVLTPTLNTGFKQMGGGLITDVVLDVHFIKNSRNDAEEFVDAEMTEEEIDIVSQENIYDLLAYSIAPEIYGLSDVKKSLLLCLVGGTDAQESGMKIRGAINVLLVGDPGVAKSQLLSYVDRLAVRSQYTTGRGSSGVGLTAAVVKDAVTGEMTLEGGALVLADKGICCIDEFDKMMDGDRTAIHEVMEQQTISIAKAGILTSLNARVSIVAAANPAFGRYNPKRSIEENIQLPAALLSRFDLLWLIQDRPDRDADRRLAEHVTFVHREGHQPKAAMEPLHMDLVRKYIAICKKKQPRFPSSLTARLVEKYVQIRNDAEEVVNSTYTSPRVLLGIIRLSTALARLHLSDEVSAEHVDEAIRLMDSAKASLAPKVMDVRRRKNPQDEAFDAIREFLVESGHNNVTRRDIIRKCVAKGIDEDVVLQGIETWTNSGVLFEDQNKRLRYTLVN
ncbi:unnamed protein product [Bursaphelenchus okinawaensis]|uniref:DNA replication licensing factor MCM7 n=1 Tax=Bursaphelenchus okinawaensis TaxID=465554 RepID=A0A811LQE1_9BILA|nr:unnamed protein product [Bursaphelenchus okinawaensis]CAG9126252.1 unnamed protein product [Bursaphelenchus okinawaensis]